MTSLYALIIFAGCSLFLWLAIYHPLIAIIWFAGAWAALPIAIEWLRELAEEARHY